MCKWGVSQDNQAFITGFKIWEGIDRSGHVGMLKRILRHQQLKSGYKVIWTIIREKLIVFFFFGHRPELYILASHPQFLSKNLLEIFTVGRCGCHWSLTWVRREIGQILVGSIFLKWQLVFSAREMTCFDLNNGSSRTHQSTELDYRLPRGRGTLLMGNMGMCGPKGFDFF